MQETEKIMIKDESEKIVGPTGIQGLSGPTGPTGNTGDTGPTGPTFCPCHIEIILALAELYQLFD